MKWAKYGLILEEDDDEHYIKMDLKINFYNSDLMI
jgi:hypothetical protein